MLTFEIDPSPLPHVNVSRETLTPPQPTELHGITPRNYFVTLT